MKIGTVAASPVPGGKLRSIDEAAARRVPGVRDVVRLDGAVAVIGDHMWAAKQGLAAAAPVWDDGPNADLSTAGIVRDLDTASQNPGVVAKSKGDAAAAIKSAAKSLDVVYQLPFLAHAPMEPINTTIHVRADGADIWVGTQVPTRAQDAVAAATGLPAPAVVVHNLMMGGAFGRRLDIDSIAQAAQIAQPRRWAGEADLDARGGHPARPLPAVLLRPDRRRSGRRRPRRWLVASRDRIFGDGTLGAGGHGAGRQARPRCGRGRRGNALRVPGPTCRICAGRNARA